MQSNRLMLYEQAIAFDFKHAGMARIVHRQAEISGDGRPNRSPESLGGVQMVLLFSMS